MARKWQHYCVAPLLEYPDDFYLHFQLGFRTDDAVERVSSYRTALALRPKSRSVHNNLGMALGMKGELDAAIERLRYALELFPDFATARGNLAHALYLKNDYKVAIAEFEKAVALNAEDVEIQNNFGMPSSLAAAWLAPSNGFNLC